MVPTDPQERSAGVWPLHRIGEAREGTRIELTIGQRSRAMATAVKWTQSYRDAWYADRNWPSYMGKSVLLVALNVVGQMLACSMAAFALSRIQWPGRELCFGIILMTMMLPGVVVMIPQFLIFRWLGWYGTLLPLWVPAFTGAPFFIFMLRQFMLTVPKDLEEAARIDGCSWFGIYWRVMLPLMRPALCAVAIFTFMGTWNDFMGPLLYLNDKRSYPLSVGLFGFRAEHLGEFNMLMAASMLMTVPAMALFFLAQRYFIEGITLSGLK
jgi:ABC-type glycerol-3-phosphate transport system permease component